MRAGPSLLAMVYIFKVKRNQGLSIVDGSEKQY